MRHRDDSYRPEEIEQFAGLDLTHPEAKGQGGSPGRRRGCIPGLGWLSQYWDPQRLVDPPERLVMIEQPTLRLFPRMIWKPVALMIIGLISFASASGNDLGPARAGVIVIAISAALLLIQYLSWALTYYVATTQRVLVVTGVIRRKFTNVQLDKIAQVQFTQSLFERTLDWGVVSIRAPGQDPANMDIRDLRHASLFYRELMYEISYGARRGPAEAQPRPMQTAPPPKPRRTQVPWVTRPVPAPEPERPDDTIEMQAIAPPPPAPPPQPAHRHSGWPSKRWSKND